MDAEAVHYLALQRAIADSAALEVQLRKDIHGSRPVLAMLVKAKKEAADAITALIEVDPQDWKEIQKQQNNVNRFRDLVRWLRDIISAGEEADQEMSQADAEALIEFLTQTPEGQEEAVSLGLVDQVRDEE